MRETDEVRRAGVGDARRFYERYGLVTTETGIETGTEHRMLCSVGSTALAPS